MDRTASFAGRTFNSVIDLWLRTDATCVPLSHVAPTFVRTRWPHDVPAGRATVVISADGRTTEIDAWVDGTPADGDRREIPIRPDDSEAIQT